MLGSKASVAHHEVFDRKGGVALKAKRMMYGRAGFELLRQRLLHAV
ncbi:MAG TPA: hypothetical protein VKR06_17915 [Ktedonosporobacter sp.]|nr:hypothetical protein [Ktedonosporobacter sp.]